MLSDDIGRSKMRYRIKFLAGVLTIPILWLSPVVGEQDNSTKVREKQGDAARGVKAWVDNCGRCHNHRGPQEFRPDQWGPIMLHMRIQAGLFGQTARDILAFLSGDGEGDHEIAPKAMSLEPKPISLSNEKGNTQNESPKSLPKKKKESDAEKEHVLKEEKVKTAFREHPAEKEPPKDEGDAEAMFNKDCAVCHGKDGKGVLSGTPNFTSSTSPLKTITDENILLGRIKSGYKNMPAKGGHPDLTDDQIKKILHYMKRAFAG